MTTFESRISQMMEEAILKTQKDSTQLCKEFLDEDIDFEKKSEYLNSRFEKMFQKFLKLFYVSEVFGDEETKRKISQKIFVNPMQEIQRLEEINSEFSQIFKSQFYSFDVLLKLDDGAIKKIVQNINNNDFVLSLKGECEELQNVFFSNISKKTAELLKDDMEFLDLVYKSVVISAQEKFLNIVHKIQDFIDDNLEDDIILDK